MRKGEMRGFLEKMKFFGEKMKKVAKKFGGIK